MSARVDKTRADMRNKSSAALAGQLTREPVVAPPATVAVQRDPEWIRLPKPSTLCPYTGLTRSKMNELILPCRANDFRPPVRSVVLRQRGKVKGVRLVNFDSLIGYIRQQETEGTEAA